METTSKPKGTAAPRRLLRDKLDDFVADWFFPIPMPAFQTAIDVERTERRKPVKGPNGEKGLSRVWYVWTQRTEPDWAFVEGDVFHAPPVAPSPWGEQVKALRWTVQIKRVLDRTVTIAVTEHREERRSEHEISMNDLAMLLRSGSLAGKFDFASALRSTEVDHVV